MEDRIADAEAEVARAQAHLAELRREAGDASPEPPAAYPVSESGPGSAEASSERDDAAVRPGTAGAAVRSDASSSPDDIVDAIALQSEAEARGNRGSEAAATVLYEEAPFVPSKDHVAAALLAILLGCFGIHKFYLGYTTAGFITLGITIVGGVFTLGVAAAVMALVGIVEGILYLTESQSKFESTHVLHVREWF
ncbi:MAG: TM2 domain-containing protein [Eggerthellaceae bacterium]|jgi:TM2 domain-containing membrane protein YozV